MRVHLDQRSRFALLFAFVCLLSAALAGCTSSGSAGMHRAPATIPESLYVAAVALKGMTQSLNQLRAVGTLSADDHRRALDEVQKAHDAAIAANAAYKAGQITQAQDGLGRVESALQIISSLLISYGASP